MLDDDELRKRRTGPDEGRVGRRIDVAHLKGLGGAHEHAVQLLNRDRLEVEATDQALGESGRANGHRRLLRCAAHAYDIPFQGLYWKKHLSAVQGVFVNEIAIWPAIDLVA